MKLLKWLLVVLGLTVIAVLALLTASNAQAQEGFVGDWVLDAAASKSPVPQLAPTAGALTIAAAGDGKFKSTTAVTEISGDRKTLTQTTTGLGQFAALSSTVVFQRK
jgi:hypothetical protein